MNDPQQIKKRYFDRLNKYLRPMASQLERFVFDQVRGYPRIDRVVARSKDIDSFVTKAMQQVDGSRKYSDPLNQIQDQIGVRIICYYASDLPNLQAMIHDYFPVAEEQMIVPDDDSEFGYEGLHYILFIPDDVRDPSISKDDCPEFFELQIKTLFQHAWAEANHDLAYKSEEFLSRDQRRKVAFTAAQAWGADLIFNELADTLLLKTVL